MNTEIKVSIVCTTYNHANYLKKALDSFLSQKTNFNYEIIVHDDASTDGTTEIIREYEKKYSDIIRPIYQSENQFSKKVKISDTFIYPVVRGKYIAYCEGDDCWCDNNKLQIQFDAMENNFECIACVHKTQIFNIKKIKKDGCYPRNILNSKNGVINIKKDPDKIITTFFHLSSWFIKKDVIDSDYFKKCDFVRKFPVGDVAMNLFLFSTGSVFYIDKIMSLYNQSTNGSWTERYNSNSNFAINHINKMIEGMIEFKKFIKIPSKLLDENINKQKMSLAIVEKNYEYIFDKQNKEFFLKLPKKVRFYLSVCRAFPGFDNAINKLKKSIKKLIRKR